MNLEGWGDERLRRAPGPTRVGRCGDRRSHV